MDYYLALKRKEILSHAATWVKVEDVMLNEINQSQKGKYCVILLLRYLKMISMANLYFNTI